MQSRYKKAYTEVLAIISCFNEEEYLKIPKEKIKFFEENKDNEYEFEIDPELELSEQNISKEANAILITLFRDYFATDRQKKVLNNLLKQNQEKLEEEKREKYNPDNIFKKEVTETEEETKEEKIEDNKQIIEYKSKESFFAKFINFIKKIIEKL